MDTSEKILKTAMSLFSQKGYKTVTTKQIAHKAGVSEMTIFRHFENKRNLFEKAFEEYVFYPHIQKIFESKIQWNLEKDLLLISTVYQEMLNKNKKLILMQFKDNELTSKLDTPLLKFPNKFKEMLTSYFTQMQHKGVIVGEPEILAVNFITANFGIFFNFSMVNQLSTEYDLSKCVENLVNIYIKGITK